MALLIPGTHTLIAGDDTHRPLPDAATTPPAVALPAGSSTPLAAVVPG